MADEKSAPNGHGAGAGETPTIQARMIGQYLKDMSFENPGAGKARDGKTDAPNINLEVSVNSRKLGAKVYESSIVLKASATNSAGSFYLFECEYAGLFQIDSIPDAALEPFLVVNGPMLLFPFVRRIVSDVTREGGYPPLLLDPIDFAGLYVHRQREIAAGREGGKVSG